MNKKLRIHPLLDAEKQKQARQYEKEKRILSLIGSGISLVFLLAFYYGGFSYRLANPTTQSTLWIFIIYVVVFHTLTTIIGLPLTYYQSYVHEHRWNFSNYTPKTWALDQLKSFLVGLILMPLLIGLLYWVMARYPANWWLIAGLGIAVVSVIFATLFPVLILPIFNKYDPIDDKELVSRLTNILKKVGLKPSGFFRQDMSRQTKKENAFLAGLGKTRRVVLADNLLDHMTIPEIESVIAHEVGHYQHAHIWKNIAVGTAQQLIVFWILDWFMRANFPHFLESVRWNLTLFPILALVMGFVSGFLFGPLNLALSRFFERQADRTALGLIPSPDAFISAMAGLANRNLSNAYPSRWIKWLYYSHPPIGERLAFAETFKSGSAPN